MKHRFIRIISKKVSKTCWVLAITEEYCSCTLHGFVARCRYAAAGKDSSLLWPEFLNLSVTRSSRDENLPLEISTHGMQSIFYSDQVFETAFLRRVSLTSLYFAIRARSRYKQLAIARRRFPCRWIAFWGSSTVSDLGSAFSSPASAPMGFL